MDRNIQFTIEFKDKATGAVSQLDLSLKDVDEVIKQVRGSIDGLSGDLVNAGQTAQVFSSAIDIIRQMKDTVNGLTQGYNDYIVAEVRLTQVMRNTMDASDAEIQSIVDLCKEQEALGVVEDDVAMAGAQELGTYLGLSSSLKTLIPVMNDMLAQQYGVNATQEAAVAIATMLGKVMEGQTSALSRCGYSFDEVQEKILKFGAEEEKAATLAEAVAESVGGINEATAQTDPGKQKQLQMEIDGVKDALGRLTSGVLPFLNIASQAGIAVMGVGQLSQATKAMTVALKGSSVATAAAAVHDKVLTAAKHLLSAATKGATVSTGALTVAVTALYAALTLGISAAITGLVALFSSMSSKAQETSRQLESVKDAQDAFSQASGEAKSHIEVEISKLKALIDAKKDTRKAVAELNSEYGKIFGTYSTAARWYDVLKSKSAAYCKQIGYEAQAKVLAQKKAEAELERNSLQSKMDGMFKPGSHATRQTLRDFNAMGARVKELNGEIATLGAQFDTCTREMANASVELSSGKGNFDAATASYDELKNEIDLLDTQLKTLAPTEIAEINRLRTKRDEYKKLYEAMGKRLGLDKGGSNSEFDGKSLIAGAASYKALGNNIAYYQAMLEKTNPAKAEEIGRIKAIIQELEQQRNSVKMLMDASALEYATELSSLDVINDNIALQQELRKTASKSNIAAIDAEIERLQALKEEVENSGFQEKGPDEITTYEELSKQLQHYEKQLQKVSGTERVEIQNTINELNELKRGWDAALLDIPSDPSNLDEYDRAISGLNAKVLLAGDNERLEIQKTLDKLKAEEQARKRLLSLPAIQAQTAKLDGLEDTELAIQLRLIGYDGIMDQVSTLMEILNDPLSPISAEQRADIEKSVKSLRKYAKQMNQVQTGSEAASMSVSAVGSIMSSLSGIVGEQAGQWLTWGANVLQAIAQAIPQIVALTQTKNLEATANTAAAATGAASSVASIPFVGPVLAVAAIASVLAAIAAIPKFADGGIAYGPTLAIFGEYAGASSNPEVVAPLDRLRNIIGNQGGTGGKVVFEIEGRKLVGILQKESRIRERG